MVYLTFQYQNETICNLPNFLLFKLAREQKILEDDEFLVCLENHPDWIVDKRVYSPERCLEYYKNIDWVTLETYLSCPAYMKPIIKRLWSSDQNSLEGGSIKLDTSTEPKYIYRYMPFNKEWLENILKKGSLFLSCPVRFNDPFDCA